ncbi:MAG TPA: amidohydrolase family protein [Vicinamibacterales bacterium]|nr:amidohydrolase family protein [Vicinamibacterales bacterium]
MKKRMTCLASLVAFGLLAQSAAGQDIAITNARIVSGTGSVIASGTIVVRGGKIVSVTQGPANTRGLKVLDVKGMTAMPGFIDAHRHINTGPNEKQQMQALLEAGYTTILSGGGPADGNITLRDHIDGGVINGPRIIPSGRIALRGNTPDNARADIRKLAAMGVKFTGEIALTPVPGPSNEEIDVLKAVVDEGKKAGVFVQVHSVGSSALMAGVDAGVRLFVHLPNKNFMSREEAKKLADTGSKILTTTGFGPPVFGVFANDNKPRFRDGKPWPESIVDGVRLGEEAGHAMVNARTTWDQGVVVGYCTDTTYDPLAGLNQELKVLNVMFSMQDIIKLMGPNTASYIQMGDELGTLEAGKLADITIVDGNPLDGYWNMLRTKIVLKGGKVVVQKP